MLEDALDEDESISEYNFLVDSRCFVRVAIPCAMDLSGECDMDAGLLEKRMIDSFEIRLQGNRPEHGPELGTLLLSMFANANLDECECHLSEF